jgi:hypothetical protein
MGDYFISVLEPQVAWRVDASECPPTLEYHLIGLDHSRWRCRDRKAVENAG